MISGKYSAKGFEITRFIPTISYRQCKFCKTLCEKDKLYNGICETCFYRTDVELKLIIGI